MQKKSWIQRLLAEMSENFGIVPRGPKVRARIKKNVQSTERAFKDVLGNHEEIFQQHMQRGVRNAHQARRAAYSGAKKLVHKKGMLKRFLIIGITSVLSCILIFLSVFFIWIGTLRTPTFDDFVQRKIASSTKIYDSTGETLLFDVHENIQRTIVALDDIALDARDAIIAIEDHDFYNHHGIDVKATIRAIAKTAFAKLGIGSSRVQGGSTLTQQVLKNTLLTSKRRLSRKMSEWFLAVKLEKVLSKDEILTHYLNEAPYGGSIYGIETASRAFFGKHASELTLAESAYLAAIPNAPTLLSPYGNNRARLDTRKNLVLSKMKEHGYINDAEYTNAIDEEVIFRTKEDQYAKAIHFVEYVRSYLEETYGKDVVENEGLNVITTLNWDLQEKAEAIVKEEALKNEEAWGASNMALVAVDPTTGGILSMVGSRDYSDPAIDGKFNVALAQRQPGSSFKPFIYATGFEMGYTDQTILFDVPTQFAGRCGVTNFSSDGGCYAPNNHDRKFLGPLTVRNALAQSRNIPAIKMQYLVGTQAAIDTARDMGISSLKEADTYGLTLVLGGGEVSLLDITSAYGVFGNDGIRNDHFAILKVTDKKGTVLEEHQLNPQKAIEPEAARMISSVLSDNGARAPLFGSNSFFYFGSAYDVAGKTGTTNNKRDAWVVGYSPSVAVGVWSGNNDNTPMRSGSTISGSAWHRYMQEALRIVPNKRFISPTPTDMTTLKPILRGVWAGGESVTIDTVSQKRATEFTPPETRKELVIPNPHSILHWVDRADPRGPIPENPSRDSQYEQWEAGVRIWMQQNTSQILTNNGQGQGEGGETIIGTVLPTESDDVHVPARFPSITLNASGSAPYSPDAEITLTVETDGYYDAKRVDYYLGDIFIGSSENEPFSLSFTPAQTDAYTNPGSYTIKAVVVDEVYNRGDDSVSVSIN